MEQQPSTGELYLDRDLTHIGLNAIHQGSISSSPLDSTQNSDFIDTLTVSDREDTIPMETAWTGSLMDRPDSVNADHVDDSVLQISGAGHWFLEGWIGDHSVEFLVDSGSSVTARSDSLYQTLVHAGTPVGALGRTSRTLCVANGTRIEISGCSHCVVSFMGLQTEFPILVCDLAAGMDAIIGSDTLGSVLPHTLDIKNGLLFTDGGVSLLLHQIDTSAISGCVITVGHCSTPCGSLVLYRSFANGPINSS